MALSCASSGITEFGLAPSIFDLPCRGLRICVCRGDSNASPRPAGPGAGLGFAGDRAVFPSLDSRRVRENARRCFHPLRGPHVSAGGLRAPFVGESAGSGKPPGAVHILDPSPELYRASRSEKEAASEGEVQTGGLGGADRRRGRVLALLGGRGAGRDQRAAASELRVGSLFEAGAVRRCSRGWRAGLVRPGANSGVQNGAAGSVGLAVAHAGGVLASLEQPRSCLALPAFVRPLRRKETSRPRRLADLSFQWSIPRALLWNRDVALRRISAGLFCHPGACGSAFGQTWEIGEERRVGRRDWSSRIHDSLSGSDFGFVPEWRGSNLPEVLRGCFLAALNTISAGGVSQASRHNRISPSRPRAVALTSSPSICPSFYRWRR